MKKLSTHVRLILFLCSLFLLALIAYRVPHLTAWQAQARVPAADPQLQILIPLYNYPNHYDANTYIWDDVAAAANSQVPITAIINPNSGPDGGPPNAEYVVGLSDLRKKYVTIVGYVSTDYGERELSEIKADVDLYDQHFNIDGIFFDEVATDKLSDYQELYEYVKTRPNLDKVIINPGVNLDDEGYISAEDPASDTAIIFENYSTQWPDYWPLAYMANYSAERFAMLVHSVPNDTATMKSHIDRAKQHNIGYVYVTDDILPTSKLDPNHPWDALPSFWSEEVAYIQQLNSMPKPTATPIPSNTAIPSATPAASATPTNTTSPSATPSAISENDLYLPIVIGSPSQGNTGITVTNTNDAGPGSLRQAVADAQAGGRIGFGVTGTIILQSQITIDKSLSIVGPGTDQIVISGNNVTRVFEVLPGKRITISGVSIVNGNAEYGGGIYNSGDLTVADSVISQNTATVHGGGVYNFGNRDTRSVFTVNNSTISKNTAPNGSGGGIHNCCAGFDSGYTTLTIEKSLIYSNTVGYSGGGIFVGNYTTFHLSESTIEKNTNMVADGWGGGLYIAQLGSHTISGSTISQNRTFGRGGGLHTAGDLTLINSTVTQNLSAMQGGGISLRATTVEVINSTISENTTQDSGGGIFSHGTLKPKGTIIANNESTDTARIDIDYFGGYVRSSGYNLVGVTAGCCGGSTEWLSSDKVGADTNPMLNRLADNGGSTHTMALQPASPAIDAIPTDNCTDIQGNPLTTDQRGTSRQGDACDIGAYEYP